MNAPEQEVLYKQWDKQEIPLQLSLKGAWDFSEATLGDILDLLAEEGLYSAPSRKELTWEALQALVGYLHRNKLDTGNLALAIQITLASRQFELDKRVQAALLTFANQKSVHPFKIVADGEWNLQSQQALTKILESYNLLRMSPGSPLLKLLQAISGRMVRIQCDDKKLIPAVPFNPFCLLQESNGKDPYVFMEDKIYRHELRQDKDIIRFTAPYTGPQFRESFSSLFAPWFMMLLLKGKASYGDCCSMEVRYNNASWADAAFFEHTPEANDFVVPPELFLRIAPGQSSVTIRYKPKAGMELEVMAIFLSGACRMAVSEGIISREKDGSITVDFMYEYFFRDYSQAAKESRVVPLGKADYMKLFFLKKDYRDNTNPKGYSPFGKNLPPDFFRLITLSEEDLKATVTIGLQFDAYPAPPSQKKAAAKKSAKAATPAKPAKKGTPAKKAAKKAPLPSRRK